MGWSPLMHEVSFKERECCEVLKKGSSVSVSGLEGISDSPTICKSSYSGVLLRESER